MRRILQTATEALNIAKIDRIAYLNAEERIFLTNKTGRPDFASAKQGEVIADMGRVIPVTLAYIDDEDEGIAIVARLTDLIAHSDRTAIKFSDAHEWARERVASYRYRASED